MTKKTKRDIGQEILEGIREIKAGGGRRYRVIANQDVDKVRSGLDISQSSFARLLGVSVRTLQAWEQGVRKPSGAALALLTIAAQRPDVVKEVLHPHGSSV